MVHLGKTYYWTTHSPRERSVFINSMVRIYKKYTGHIPELIGLTDIVDATLRQGTVRPAGKAVSNTRGSSPRGSSEHLQRQKGLISPQTPVSQNASTIDVAGAAGVVGVAGAAAATSTATASKSSSISSSRINILQPPRNITPTGSPQLEGTSSPPSGQRSLSFQKKSQDLNGAPSDSGSSQGKPQRPTIDTSVSGSGPSSARSIQSTAIESPVTTRSIASSGAPGPYSNEQLTIPKTRQKSTTSGSSASVTSTSNSLAITTDQIDLNNNRNNNFSKTLKNNEVDHITEKSTLKDTRSTPTETPLTGLAIELPSENSDETASIQPRSEKGHKREKSAIQGISFVSRSTNAHDIQNDDSIQSSDNGSIIISENNNISQELIAQEQDDTMTEMKNHKKQQSSTSSSRVSWSRRRLSFSAMSNVSAVEETLGEFNWTGRDDASSLEKSISKELSGIESAHLHDVVDLDNRLGDLDKSLETAIAECERLDAMFAFFSMQMGNFSDEISHIESQGQGLQVQTTNQKILWNELHDILQTASMRNDSMEIIRKAGFDDIDNLTMIEKRLLELYSAVKAVRPSDTEEGSDGRAVNVMRALKEKKHVHEQLAIEFMAHFKEFFESKITTVLKNAESSLSDGQNNEDPQLQRVDDSMLRDLYPYSGIILFTKEIDNVVYNSCLRSYEYTVKQHFDTSISGFMIKWRRKISNLSGKNGSMTFAGKEPPIMNEGIVSKSLKRSGTLAKFREGTGKGAERSSTLSSSVSSSQEETIPVIDRSKRLEIQRSLKKLVDSITSGVVAQQEALILLFHLASFGEFPVFIERFPAKSRTRDTDYFKSPHIREIDSDRVRAQDVASAVGTILESMQEQLNAFTEYLADTVVLSLPSFIALLELSLKKLEATNQDFLVSLLQRIRDKAAAHLSKYLSEQMNNINSTIITSKKRGGIVRFVRVFPTFSHMVEEDLAQIALSEGDAVDNLRCRRLIDEAYENIGRAMFYNLQRNANEHDTSLQTSVASSGNSDHEDKEKLNYHVMMIENMSVLADGLVKEDNFSLQQIYQRALEVYRKELDMYTKTVMHRPMGKIMDFIEGIETILEKNSEANPTQRHGYSKSVLRKVLVPYDSKEVKKGIENLRRRVEKHFSDEDRPDNANLQLVDKVWSALQAEYISYYTRLVKLVARYYMEPGVEITSFVDFSKTDILAAFAKSKY